MQGIYQLTTFFESALGLGAEPKHLTLMNMVLRGAIMFAAALVMVRSGDKRFFSRKSAFDVILGFMLASVLSACHQRLRAVFPNDRHRLRACLAAQAARRRRATVAWLRLAHQRLFGQGNRARSTPSRGTAQ